MDMNSIMRMLPSVDKLMQDNRISGYYKYFPKVLVTDSIREGLYQIRMKILKNELDISAVNLFDETIKTIINRINKNSGPNLKKVVNGTGVILHTNLGRSILSEKVKETLWDVSGCYSTLEYNLEKGERGERYSHVDELLCKLTGAEGAMVVNNNAAAVLLLLSALAKDKEVIVSRGELIEIGGSFRVPEVISQGGAKMVEVGTTNKTHLKDYENAINGKTAAILKIHTSNYRVIGFTEGVSGNELVKLGEKYNLPVIEDLGSGMLIDFQKYNLPHEPTVQEVVSMGLDLVTFSGDKLLGGPQAGIIVGKKHYIELLKGHPLTRALRIDKMTLAALEGTLRLYFDEEKAIKEIPVLKMLMKDRSSLRREAKKLHNKLKKELKELIDVEVVETEAQPGGGSLPEYNIPSYGVQISSKKISTPVLNKRLHQLDVPIIGRIIKNKLILDVRTLQGEDNRDIVTGLQKVLLEV